MVLIFVLLFLAAYLSGHKKLAAIITVINFVCPDEIPLIDELLMLTRCIKIVTFLGKNDDED